MLITLNLWIYEDELDETIKRYQKYDNVSLSIQFKKAKETQKNKVVDLDDKGAGIYA